MLSNTVHAPLNHFLRGGAANLGKPELEKVMQRRRLDADGRPGAIRNNRSASPNPAGGGGDELAMQLKRRTQMLEEVSQFDYFEWP